MDVSDLAKEIEKLKAENEKLKEALRFACAEDMWVSNGEYDEWFKYKYGEWYQDHLRAVLKEVGEK